MLSDRPPHQTFTHRPHNPESSCQEALEMGTFPLRIILLYRYIPNEIIIIYTNKILQKNYGFFFGICGKNKEIKLIIKIVLFPS